MKVAWRRRAAILSVLAAASALFVFTRAYPERLIPVDGMQAILLVGLAVIGIAATLARLRIGIVALGILSILIGLARLVAGNAIVSGGVGTGALFVGLGIAFVAVASADRVAQPENVAMAAAERKPTDVG